ncbi:hypothetical protein EJ06DRAFT_582069 [Trichodelitschia bisporula]|uniref:Uncharacterized protein n=1 Tax=Trichodelitschia bisporula TaxID=703511 RepID=A0A6G1HVZ7_9PEZI|nr:hypothetical protein EJ06DRAFT_582069 [Trichodelitschia bisporula]
MATQTRPPLTPLPPNIHTTSASATSPLKHASRPLTPATLLARSTSSPRKRPISAVSSPEQNTRVSAPPAPSHASQTPSAHASQTPTPAPSSPAPAPSNSFSSLIDYDPTTSSSSERCASSSPPTMSAPTPTQATPACRPVRGARSSIELMRLRLRVAIFKVETGQTTVPLANLRLPTPPPQREHVASPKVASLLPAPDLAPRRCALPSSPPAELRRDESSTTQDSERTVEDTPREAAALLELAMGRTTGGLEGRTTGGLEGGAAAGLIELMRSGSR